MEKIKIDALRAFAHDVRFQFYAREAIADGLELIAEQMVVDDELLADGMKKISQNFEMIAARLDAIEAFLEQLKPPAEPVAQTVAQTVQTATDTNVGA